MAGENSRISRGGISVGVLFGIVELKMRRDQLFEKYRQIRDKQDKTTEEKMLQGSLVVRISDIDDQIRDANRKAALK